MPYATAATSPRRRARRRTGSSPIKTSITGTVKAGVPSTRVRPLVGRDPSQAPPPAQQLVVPTITLPPPTRQGEDIRANAAQDLAGAQNAWRGNVFAAAMSLGSPEVLAALRANPEFTGYNFSEDPTSQWSQIGTQEKRGLEDVDSNSNLSNIFFSGFRLRDRGLVGESANNARAAAVREYEQALREYGAALTAAQSAYNKSQSEANQADIDYATSIPPEDRTTPPAGSMPVATAPPSAQPTTKKKPKKKPSGGMYGPYRAPTSGAF